MLKGQDWKTTELNFVKTLSHHRSELMAAAPESTFELKTILENWSAKESDSERIKNLIFQIQFGIKVLGWSCEKIQKKLKETYPGFILAEEFSEKEYDVLSQNADLLNLITLNILKSKYPFQIESKSSVFRELEFYEFKQNESIGEIGAGNGMFSTLLSLLDKDLALFVNELGFNKIRFLKKSMYENFASDHASKIKIIKGKKRKTNFENQSLDKIIIRNSFHHFSKKEAMLVSIKEALKPEGILFLNEPWISEKGCKERLEKSEIKSILQQNGFTIEKEMEFKDILFLKCRPNPTD